MRVLNPSPGCTRATTEGEKGWKCKKKDVRSNYTDRRRLGLGQKPDELNVDIDGGVRPLAHHAMRSRTHTPKHTYA
eukprot:6175962-Pleurochrysis_carterae.AAC.1